MTSTDILPKESFSVSKFHFENQINVWHHHDQLELVYIKDNFGTRFIGDSIQKFVPGDLILIGANLPHMWLNDSTFSGAPNFLANAITVHFEKNCFGENFFQLPEMSAIRKLLEDANRGIHISGQNSYLVAHYMEEITNLNNFDRTLMLLKILKTISEEPLKTYQSTTEFVDSYFYRFTPKLDKVLKLVMCNFRTTLTLEHGAEEVNMHPSSFSRYFKKTAKKTFTSFVNETRIRYACKMLTGDQDKQIAQIAHESGFDNLSTFNKQFKAIIGTTPSSFVKAKSRDFYSQPTYYE